MIKALAADGADDAFDERILPGGPWSHAHLSNPHAGDAPDEGLAVDGIPIAEHISRSGLLREGLENLAGGPVGRRVIRDVEVEEFAAIVAEDDEDKEKAEGEGGTTKKSMATMSRACAVRKARHVGDGRGDVRCMYLATVSSATA